MAIIYLIQNKINKKCYVGQSKNTLKQRVGEHISSSKNPDDNMTIHKAIRKYGKDNFIYSVICECNPLELDEQEIYWIKYWNCLGRKGYNSTTGGSNDYKHSDETIEKIRLSNIGRIVSNETKVKQSKAQLGNTNKKGKLLSIDTIEKIRHSKQKYKDNIYSFYNKQTGDLFVGTKYELEEKYNLKKYQINKVITNDRESYLGWTINKK